MKQILVLALLLVQPCLVIFSAEVPPIAPLLMESTFKIEGQASNGQKKMGSCFLMRQPIPASSNWAWNVLITANHVLADISANEATVYLRTTNSTGGWTKEPYTIPIRDNGTPLWLRHPEADVAAMIVSLPKNFVNSHRWLPEAWLAGDATYKERDIRPGDELMCLGYPLGLEANESGFPILRSGRIASYPVYPSDKVKTYLFDFPIYGGNSGGPVFFDFRKRPIPGESAEKWVDVIGIAGIVSQDISHTVHVEGYFETITRRDPLGLAIVVPAEFVIQTLKMVVEREENKAKAQQSPAGDVLKAAPEE